MNEISLAHIGLTGNGTLLNGLFVQRVMPALFLLSGCCLLKPNNVFRMQQNLKTTTKSRNITFPS